MKVTHIIPALFTPDGGIVGGAERYALELARAMSHSIPTTLVSFGVRPESFEDGPLVIRVLGPAHYLRGQRTNPVALCGLFSIVRNSDIVHCHQQHILNSSITAILARLLRKKVFVTDLGGGGLDVSAFISTDRWYNAHLHISEYSRRIFAHSTNPNAHVVLGGVDTSKFSPAATPENPHRALYVGRLLPHKGINYLVEAAGTDIGLDVIGRAYHARFSADLSRSSPTPNIKFEHNASDEQIITAYRNALCIVLPSVYTDLYGGFSKVPELLGQTLLEGMACGIPAICSDVASLPEIVQHGVTGFIVPPNDPPAIREKLLWLLHNPHEAAAMGRAARRRILEKFTWPAVVSRCLHLYEGKARKDTSADAHPVQRASQAHSARR